MSWHLFYFSFRQVYNSTLYANEKIAKHKCHWLVNMRNKKIKIIQYVYIFKITL